MSAIVGFCTGQSVYAEALVMTAIEENIVLSIPAAALARACGVIPEATNSAWMSCSACRVPSWIPWTPRRRAHSVRSWGKAVIRIEILPPRMSCTAPSNAAGQW
ncbi:MAG: hypothetical protein JO100_09385 [Pseudonocardia sp.]|nr:hypothetical protein [Pseudonocardia sp.]